MRGLVITLLFFMLFSCENSLESVPDIDSEYQKELSSSTDSNYFNIYVEELKFEYSHKAEDEELPPVWKDYWDQAQEGIPLGVKIHLKVKRERGETGEFTKTVFIPTGILGKEEAFGDVEELESK